MGSDFAVFILSHGRAENVITYNTLRRDGYTGEIYIVIDDEDSQGEKYKKLYGEKVLVFSKAEIAKRFDTYDTSSDFRTVVFARNACFDFAKELGYRYFCELDDDYTSFQYRYPQGEHLLGKEITNLDFIFSALLEFYRSSDITSLAMAQGGDFIGGINGGNYKKKILRKAMNSFICSTERPFFFVGRINEDVNTYTTLGSRGKLFLTVTDLMLTQVATQTNKGGMTDVYNANGTYLKSFFSILSTPSAVSIRMMGDTHVRIHHHIQWDYCVPKIINAKWRKGERKNGNGKTEKGN